MIKQREFCTATMLAYLFGFAWGFTVGYLVWGMK